MKHLLSIIMVVIASIGSAQNLAILPSQKIDCEISTTEINEYDILFSTENPEAITFRWELLENTVPSDWDYSLCDYTTCYIGIPDKSDMKRISLEEAQNGTKGFLKINVLTANSNGSYVMRYYVYDSADYDRGDTVSFNFINTTVSVNDIAANTEVTLYPNPTQDVITIESENMYSELEIVDVSGRVILAQNLVGVTAHNIDLSNVQAGVYLVFIRAEGVLRKSRFIISD